jgi:hypothetical protein
MRFRLHSDLRPAGDQPKAIEELVAGLRAGERDQFGHIGDRQRGMYRQDQRSATHDHDGGEVTARVVAQARVERGIDHQRAIEQQYGVAVWRSLGDMINADIAARTWPVFNHDLLLERLAPLGCDQSGHKVTDPAGRIRHDHANRSGWKRFLRVRGRV